MYSFEPINKNNITCKNQITSYNKKEKKNTKFVLTKNQKGKKCKLKKLRNLLVQNNTVSINNKDHVVYQHFTRNS